MIRRLVTSDHSCRAFPRYFEPLPLKIRFSMTSSIRFEQFSHLKKYDELQTQHEHLRTKPQSRYVQAIKDYIFFTTADLWFVGVGVGTGVGLGV